MIADRRLDLPRMYVSSYHNARNLPLHQQTSHIVRIPAVNKLNLEYATLPIRSLSYFAWSRNRRKQIIHCHYAVLRSSMAICNRCPISTFLLQLAQYGLKHSCFFFSVSRLPHVPKFLFCSHTVFSLNLHFL